MQNSGIYSITQHTKYDFGIKRLKTTHNNSLLNVFIGTTKSLNKLHITLPKSQQWHKLKRGIGKYCYSTTH